MSQAETNGFKDKNGKIEATNLPNGISLFDIYPNPASNGQIFVKLNAGLSGRLSVINATGNTIWIGNIKQLNQTSVQSIDLSGAPNGVYMVVLNTNSQVFSKTLIIK